MKKVIFTVIVLIALGTAWALYLRWDNKRFVESLPKIPSETNIEKSTDTIVQDRKSEDEDSNFFNLEDTSKDNKPLVEDSKQKEEKIPLDAVHRHPHDERSHPHDHAPPISAPSNASAIMDAATVMNLPIEEVINISRQRLIEEHGNIPEIDIYLKELTPIWEAVKSGKTKLIIQRTPEEDLEFRRVMAKLFPNEQNIKLYQDKLKKEKK